MAIHPSNPKNKGPVSVVKIFAPILAIVFLVLAALYGIKATLPTRQTPTSSPITASTPGDSKANPQLAELSLTQLGGKSVKISDLNAKVFFLNFWATWCEACIEEMPSIVKLRDEYRDRGFEVLGINVDENPDAVVPRAVKQFNMKFPVFVDPEGKLSEMFDVHAIPLTVIMKKNGEVLGVLNGGRDWYTADVKNELERWLSG